MPLSSSHPNANVSLYTGALSVLIIYAVGFAGIEPTAEVGAALATVLTGLALLLGRRKTDTARPEAIE